MFWLPTDQCWFLKLISTSCLISPALSLRPHHVLILKKWSGHLISSKNEPEKAFVRRRNAHKTERSTVWSDSGCYTSAAESHGNAGRRSAGPHSAGTMWPLRGLSFQSGLTQITTSWAKVAHFNQQTHAQTYLMALVHIWLMGIINKTYGCLKSNHWGNGPVNDLTPQSIAHGCWIIGTFQMFTQYVYKPLFHLRL